MSFKIGNLKLENNIFLAPMAKVTNAPFRLQCKMRGAGLCYSPLMDEDGVIQAFSKFNDFLKIERPVAGQLVGADPKILSEAARIIEPFVDLVDLNFGCPDKDVILKKAGVYHIKETDKIDKIIRSIKCSVNIPVTAKIRTGWDAGSLNYLKVSKIIEDSGADAICVHARTREQGYSGFADWNAIKEIKENTSMVVIGNGDVNSPEKAKEMFERTNCDALMIGRASIGNPFIFSQINEYLKKGTYNVVTPIEKIEAFRELINLYNEYDKNYKFHELRTQALWFTKGLENAARLRQNLLNAKNNEELNQILIEYQNKK